MKSILGSYHLQRLAQSKYSINISAFGRWNALGPRSCI